MKPSSFEMYTPNNIEDALSLLDKHGDEAKIITGGQSLVPTINMRLATPKSLIDLNRIDGLRYIKKEDNKILIGGVTRHHDLETSSLIKEHCPLLGLAAGCIGHLAIRYRGTIGGSLAHADPAATLPVALLTLDGKVKTTSVNGVREFDAEEFFYGIFTTAMEENEILTEVEIPIVPKEAGYSFSTLTRIHGDFPLLAVGVLMEVEEEKIVKARLTVGGINPLTERIVDVEEMLIGKKPSDELFYEAAQSSKDFMEPESDISASAEYRLHMVGVYVEEALKNAWQNIGKVGN
ncbi:xanthine dehydrogenase family protein subunit M [Alteribacillus sp. YIM 98480]|uniref:FAD binding domain-containing protein n=1 Tax=Alteribacillus sp. YIM 98480 TaxID=2606599 RepID=UPI00131B98FC|nr:xanthine dehydrogenase family protein subunit M [Alteribacillus sp. YIM 98480]